MILLSRDADLFILDEPTSGVDPEYRFYIRKALDALQAMNKIIFLSTHQSAEIESHRNYFYFLRDGRTQRFETGAQCLQESNASSLEEAFVQYVTDAV